MPPEGSEREMNNPDDAGRRASRWAELRFAIVGPLLAAPPDPGELQAELKRLAERTWRRPETDEPITFGVSTIERWLYAARKEGRDPVGALRRKVRNDAGRQRSLSTRLRAVLRGQYKQHPSWSYQLHVDNVEVEVEADPELGPMTSYSTIRRYMRTQGLRPVPRKAARDTAGAQQAIRRRETCEILSYESEYVGGLWHSDFHEASRQVLMRDGRRVTPQAFCLLDDCSRLACHIQWYLDENTEMFVHGLSQGIQKRGLPRSLMTDRGGAMMSAESTQGLKRLGIEFTPTLPYSPYQNAKQEVFWANLEGRLMAMLDDCPELTLDLLNVATQAWAELEYNREVHTELGVSPLKRFLDGKSVSRESPGSEDLRRAFRVEETRSQRHSDGTVSIESVRFQIPSRYRNLDRVTVRYSRWDLSVADLVDGRTGTILCTIHPLDKIKNGSGQRALFEPPIGSDAAALPDVAPRKPGMAPLLRKLIAEYAATGLPPAYIPTPDSTVNDDDADQEGAP
jgi:putative transposase